MPKMNKKDISVTVVVFFLAALFLFLVFLRAERGEVSEEVIRPMKEDIKLTIVTTGIIQPQNRLEIKPSIGGRIEEVLVKEGDEVFSGQVLARMSSTERAALIDAARLETVGRLDYWNEVYRKSPLIAPINGSVIARYVEPGQTVSAADTILVLSDRLVVSAQFDETDIGRVELGQEALVNLDAYPDIKLQGTVDHIAYESEIVNNVTIYNVDVLIEDMPDMLRSGMSVTVELVERYSPEALTVPSSVLERREGKIFLTVKDRRGLPLEKEVAVGIDNNNRAEILSGVNAEEEIFIRHTGSAGARRTAGRNPFLPSRRR